MDNVKIMDEKHGCENCKYFISNVICIEDGFTIYGYGCEERDDISYLSKDIFYKGCKFKVGTDEG